MAGIIIMACIAAAFAIVPLARKKKGEPVSTDRLLKWMLVAVAIVLAYLFLLNGRYADMEGGYCFDKWKCKYVEIVWEE